MRFLAILKKFEKGVDTKKAEYIVGDVTKRHRKKKNILFLKISISYHSVTTGFPPGLNRKSNVSTLQPLTQDGWSLPQKRQ